MKLTNARNGNVITSNAKYCENFMDRLFGLIDTNNPRDLFFKTRFGIHTFFLNSKIDVILLDNENTVVKTSIGLSPYRFFFYNPKFSNVVELKPNTINKTDIKVGDKILFE